MTNKIQILSIQILHSNYKIILLIFFSLITNLLFSNDSFVFCSTEGKDEYIRFLESEAWELDSRINELEKRVGELEHLVNDLRETVAEQKSVINAQQELLTQVEAKLSESKK